MPKLRVYKGFVRMRNKLASPRLRARVDNVLRTIEHMPGMGSSLIADSIRERYGQDVLKALVVPYLIIYEYDRDQDMVYVYDLISCWTVR